MWKKTPFQPATKPNQTNSSRITGHKNRSHSNHQQETGSHRPESPPPSRQKQQAQQATWKSALARSASRHPTTSTGSRAPTGLQRRSHSTHHGRTSNEAEPFQIRPENQERTSRNTLSGAFECTPQTATHGDQRRATTLVNHIKQEAQDLVAISNTK